jgi:hypothetical protein
MMRLTKRIGVTNNSHSYGDQYHSSEEKKNRSESFHSLLLSHTSLSGYLYYTLEKNAVAHEVPVSKSPIHLRASSRSRNLGDNDTGEFPSA